MQQKIAGFQQVRSLKIPEQDMEVLEYHHDKSGGRVIWLKNEDENRAFGIGFLTPPTDSTGVAHIVEHAVLSGSRKYPLKDPFMGMVKQSMNTFLNAMTYQDMTLFPVASMNEEDFHHLMDIYLDAVFFPKMYQEKYVFQQEGYHRELYAPEEDITLNGIVYNEMRGVYSSPDREVMQQIDETFHQGSTVAYESGGYPYAMSQLTYEDFLAFHRKHYRPNNAITVLYGKIDIDKALSQIDQDFFSHFQDEGTPIRLNCPPVPEGDRRQILFFDGDEAMTTEKDSYLSYHIPFAKGDSLEEIYLYQWLMTALVEGESSPLHQALVDGGYCQEVSIYASETYYQDFSLLLEKVDSRRADDIIAVIEETLKRVAHEGLDRDLLKACLQQMEFSLREMGGAERGVTTFIQLMSAWRYQKDPLKCLQYNRQIENLKQYLEGDRIEQVILDRLVHFKSRLVLVHEPKQDYHKNLDYKLAQQLAQEKEAMTSLELEQLLEENKGRLRYQQRPDRTEDLQKLPQLKKSDISEWVVNPTYEEISFSSGQIGFFHPETCGGIHYLTFSFPVTSLSVKDLSALKHWSILLASLSTEQRDFSDLEVNLAKVAKGVRFVPQVFVNQKDSNRYTLQFMVHLSTLTSQTSQALTLIREILTQTLFEDKERIRNILKRVKADLEERFDQSGHQLAIGELASQYSEAKACGNSLSGLAYYDALCEFLANFEMQYEDFKTQWQSFSQTLCQPNQCVVTLCSDEEGKEELIADVEEFLEGLGQVTQVQVYRPMEVETASRGNEGIISNSQVQYVVQGGRLLKPGERFNGHLPVVGNIISNEILHERIRVQGGAYGGGLSLLPTGEVFAYSYRDSHLNQTLEAYKGVGHAVRDLHLTQEEVDQFILGAVTRYQYPYAAKNVNEITLKRYFKGVTVEDCHRELKELLATTPEQVEMIAERIDRMLSEAQVVVYGNQDKLEKNRQVFDRIRPLKKN
ncbi:hypothetical protein CYJ27_07930 [Aerococcus christensenii]|uniref:Peptidase M16C associated domain-containing protein n=1 Tax=Aerococcus christensenii TaxID=87541 RepID=A0A2I1K5A3_9LACT|nr:insulinase family protein [Aerococcus christensenii]PKY90823.1 hypothetical protein CYJ27_07930 [Aerococcus christensenii]